MHPRIIPYLAAAAAAASVQSGSAAAQVSEAPADVLARNVRILAAKPSNVSALVAAGRAALKLGDSTAAAGFFGRADALDPSNPETKLGLGATLVAMGRPRPALVYFARARQLGATASSIGSDRGLAYDLLGDQAAAQADYVSALAGTDAKEARRRLALSLAISGDHAGAVRALEPLINERDRPAARVQALVLALGGDPAAGTAAFERAMPGAGAEIAPYLRKLAGLTAMQKAAAVNLGVFPGEKLQPNIPAPSQSFGQIDRDLTDPGMEPQWQGAIPGPMQYGGQSIPSVSNGSKATPPDGLALYGVFPTR